jgi:hypothetical protein
VRSPSGHSQSSCHPRLGPNRHDEVLESNQAATVSFARDAVHNHRRPPLQPPISRLDSRLSTRNPPSMIQTHCQINAYLIKCIITDPPYPTLLARLLLLSSSRHSSRTHLPAFISSTVLQILSISTLSQPHQFHPSNLMFGVASGVESPNSAGGAPSGCEAVHSLSMDLGRELGVNHATPSC